MVQRRVGLGVPKAVIYWIAGALAVIAAALLINTARHGAGWPTRVDTPKERAARLAPYWQLVLPDGPGPHPAAVLLSGCDGVRDNMQYWATVLADHGRAALILDSHRPRGLDALESWRLVCAGQALPGAERAGDLAVALDALSGMDGLTDDIVVLGASHGGWTAMEFVRLAASGDIPPGLSGWPSPPEGLLKSVSALVVLYPYCGVLNAADSVPWSRAGKSLKMLMILAEDDSIVSTGACLSMADALREGGAEIETVVLPNADHGFDQSERSWISPLQFDAGLRAEAQAQVEAFLERVETP